MADQVSDPCDTTTHAPAWRKTVASAAAMFSLALLASGCGAPKINYAIPSSLCDIPVSRDLLRPLFPPGDRIEFDGDSFPDDGKATSFCQYYVDGNAALSVEARRSSENGTAEERVRRFASHAHLKFWARPDGHTAGYSGSAFGTSRCSGTPSDSHGQPARTFALEISVNHFTSTNELRPRLEKIMDTLLPKAAHARGC
ncbi:hypothetical protein [Streptomyces sp. NPDC048516]|uniref:hypothetical protein n=1 Tax=Streptomyces sp. NPDC048516 TaxID=3365565 RepID=UPI003717F291